MFGLPFGFLSCIRQLFCVVLVLLAPFMPGELVVVEGVVAGLAEDVRALLDDTTTMSGGCLWSIRVLVSHVTGHVSTFVDIRAPGDLAMPDLILGGNRRQLVVSKIDSRFFIHFNLF